MGREFVTREELLAQLRQQGVERPEEVRLAVMESDGRISVLRQAFLQLPRDFWDAVQSDGAGRWLFLWRVAVPLTLPTVLTATLFALLARWKAVLWPLIITSSEELRPVQVAMLYFRSEEGPNFHYLMAAATLVALPGVVLYLFAQRHFTEGLASAGVKG